MIQTVLGPIPAAELSVTLPHEHFFCGSTAANLAEPPDPRDRALAKQPVSLEIRDWLEYNWHCNGDNLVLNDEATAIAEAMRYRQAGGRSIIDPTSGGIGRNPQGLARIAKQTGLHIVIGCGYYVEATHPPAVAKMTPAQITDEIVDQFANGLDGTGIKPGVIGEVGCSWPLTATEEKSLRASAKAQKILGAAMEIHPGKHPDALAQIVKILQTTEVDMRRVILCHVDRTLQDVRKLVELLKTGCTVEYDLFSRETTGNYYRSVGITMLSDAQRLDHLRAFIDAGFLKQLLISHDVSFKHQLHKYGGQGYDHILVNIIPWMRQRGFTQAEIDALMIHNSRRMFDLPE